MNEAINSIKLSACISAQDGVISTRELDTCYEIASSLFPKLTKDIFDKAIDDFFDENLELEDYLDLLEDCSIEKKAVLQLCYESAVSDGFEIRENFAFIKACKFFGVSEEEFVDA